MIKHFEDKYAVKDKQDALAMCALQLATQSEQENVSEAKINEEVGNRLEYLNKAIQEVIDL
jgi:cell division protein ZapA